MAPVDRREHRQQRVRGAGPSSVQASFGFSFGALGAPPVQKTPRGANGPAQPPGSASLQRSSVSRRNSTPSHQTVTPQLGKRKRGSVGPKPGADDGEHDELSPDRDDDARSMEKSRRVVGTASPIRDEQDDGPDELSVLEHGASIVRENVFAKSTVMKRTPPQTVAQPRAPSGSATQETRTTGMNRRTWAASRRSTPRRSKSTDAVPATPGLLPDGQPSTSSASRVKNSLDTPAAAPAEEEAEDELSPQAVASTPRVIGSEARPQQTPQEETEMDVDELSPQVQPTPTQKWPTPPEFVQAPAQENTVELSSVREESDEEEEAEATPRPAPKRPSPRQVQPVKPSAEKPPRKRHRFLGPKQAISVMRIKGSTVRGITVADTTRTILEENIDYRLERMAEKLHSSQDSDRRKELRSQINLFITFKESLNEKLMDLQDANDVLSTNFHKAKLFSRANADLRKEILALQNNRQEIAIEQDDIQTQYDAEKAKVDAKNTLSDDLFAIEAAIKNGRAKAHNEGREKEGPDIPLSMLLENVGKHVGSRGGGLLANVKTFNGLLERAVGWLEGKA